MGEGSLLVKRHSRKLGLMLEWSPLAWKEGLLVPDMGSLEARRLCQEKGQRTTGVCSLSRV